MKSYEVIRVAVDEPGVKAVAGALKVSPALVYKWCEQPADSDDPEQSGAKNPLDRVREMFMLTKDIRLIRWLCNEAGGFFISNPVPELRRSLDETIFGETRSMVRDCSVPAANRASWMKLRPFNGNSFTVFSSATWPREEVSDSSKGAAASTVIFSWAEARSS